LYGEAVRRFGDVSTLIEWDDLIPSFERLEEESEHARAVRTQVRGNAEARASAEAGA
jgi:uncharacterized protein (UPF0276 family)